MSQRPLKPAACLLLAACGLSGFGTAGVANAQGADSVEGFMRRVFGPPEHDGRKSRDSHRRTGETPKKRETPAKDGTEAEAGTTAEPVTTPSVAAQPVPVPSPDPRAETHEETADSAGSVPRPTPSPAPSVAPADAATNGRPAPVPGQPNAVKPPPIDAQPPEDIPVPVERPATASAAAAPTPEATEPPVEGEAGVEPSTTGEAPNSTEKLKSREPTIDPATSVVAAAAIEDAEECEAELKKRGVVFTVKESISEGECGVLRPVAFERASSGIKVSPGTQMLCRAALALDTWLTDSVVPAAKADFPDRTLTEFRQASTYVCRPRASENGISEHARGSAIDIGAFVFDKGGDIGVAAQPDGSPEAKFQATVRAGACGPFKTVLGPGTDPDHATHFHLDIAARRNGSTYCK